MIKVWIVWYYDDAICPEKQLWGVYKDEKKANEVAQDASKENPDCEFEVEGFVVR